MNSWKKRPFWFITQFCSFWIPETDYFPNEYSKNRSLWRRRRRRLGPQTPERKQSLFVLLKKYSSSSFSDLYRDGCCVQEGLNWKRGSGCKNKFFFQVYWSSSILAPQTYVWHLSHIFRGSHFSIFIFVHFIFKGGFISDRFFFILKKFAKSLSYSFPSKGKMFIIVICYIFLEDGVIKTQFNS